MARIQINPIAAGPKRKVSVHFSEGELEIIRRHMEERNQTRLSQFIRFELMTWLLMVDREQIRVVTFNNAHKM